MANSFFSQIRSYTSAFLRYLLFFLNLALLAGLGIKTAKAWVSDPFDFLDILDAFPGEPEFLDRAAAEKQFWMALSFETIVFIIGGFICYEILIKKKTIRRGLIAPLVIAFLWLTGESAFFFMPATDKGHTISVCRNMGISWNTKRGRCNLMDLETQRFARMAAAKKTKRAVVLPVRPAPVKPETAPQKKAASPVPAKQQPPVPAKTESASAGMEVKKPASAPAKTAPRKEKTPSAAPVSFKTGQAAPKPAAASKGKKPAQAKEEKSSKPALKAKPAASAAPAEKKPAAKKAQPAAAKKKQAKAKPVLKTEKTPSAAAEKKPQN